MEHDSDADLKRLRPWCEANDIPVSTLYEKLKLHGLKPIKIGRGSYLDRQTRQLFVTGQVA